MKSLLGMFRTADDKSHAGTFLLVCGIFVCTGLCNGMIDSLNKHFQNSFEVSKAASGFVQFFWYLAYFVLALPSGWYARRFGYRSGIVTGLTLVVLGSLIVYPTHFALGIRGLGERTKLASSFMVMAILGGAVAPMLMGRLADRFSIRIGLRPHSSSLAFHPTQQPPRFDGLGECLPAYTHNPNVG